METSVNIFRFSQFVPLLLRLNVNFVEMYIDAVRLECMHGLLRGHIKWALPSTSNTRKILCTTTALGCLA